MRQDGRLLNSGIHRAFTNIFLCVADTIAGNISPGCDAAISDLVCCIYSLGPGPPKAVEHTHTVVLHSELN